MGLFTALWSATSGIVITIFVVKIVQNFLKGKMIAIAGVVAGAIAVWMFATFPVETLNLLSGMLKDVVDWFGTQFKI